MYVYIDIGYMLMIIDVEKIGDFKKYGYIHTLWVDPPRIMTIIPKGGYQPLAQGFPRLGGKKHGTLDERNIFWVLTSGFLNKPCSNAPEGIWT